MLSELVHYQGKAGFFKLNFKNGISWNTDKYELGGFSLRQLHMICLVMNPNSNDFLMMLFEHS